MKHNKIYDNIPVHETLFIGICLAFVGGYLDAYTYILKGGVFANAQTGNMVLFGINLVNGSVLNSLLYLIPVAAFFAGVLLTELFKRKLRSQRFVHWQHIVIIIETMLLFAIGFLPESVPNAVINVLVSFICSMQVNSFRQTNGLPYASTMCTGNLRSAGEHFFTFLYGRDKAAGKKALRYSVIIFVFCLGAAVGALLSGLLGGAAVWICCGVLSAVLAVMFFGR